MSDFDTITSCHSPASRQNAYQSYYKCAVAEAQGHGAVAYVVETEDLLSATNTGNINSAEQEIQEGEIFVDDKRHLAVILSQFLAHVFVMLDIMKVTSLQSAMMTDKTLECPKNASMVWIFPA